MQIRNSLRVCTWKGVFFLLPSEKLVDIKLVTEASQYSHPAATIACLKMSQSREFLYIGPI